MGKLDGYIPSQSRPSRRPPVATPHYRGAFTDRHDRDVHNLTRAPETGPLDSALRRNICRTRHHEYAVGSCQPGNLAQTPDAGRVDAAATKYAGCNAMGDLHLSGLEFHMSHACTPISFVWNQPCDMRECVLYEGSICLLISQSVETQRVLDELRSNDSQSAYFLVGQASHNDIRCLIRTHSGGLQIALKHQVAVDTENSTPERDRIAAQKAHGSTRLPEHG